MRRLDHGELNIHGRTGSINRDLDRYQKQQEAIAKEKAKDLRNQKAAAKLLLAEYRGEMTERYGKEQMSILEDWAKWQPSNLIRFVHRYLCEKKK